MVGEKFARGFFPLFNIMIVVVVCLLAIPIFHTRRLITYQILIEAAARTTVCLLVRITLSLLLLCNHS